MGQGHIATCGTTNNVSFGLDEREENVRRGKRAARVDCASVPARYEASTLD
jgi:hypothetical protein